MRLFILFILILVLLNFSGANAKDPYQLKFLDKGDGNYEIISVFNVTASSQVVWDVLTDYENIPRFMSSLTDSKVKKRHANELLVEQTASIPLFLWVKTDRRVLLDVTEFPYSQINFVDLAHDQIQSYDGSWEIKPLGPVTQITYRMRIRIPYIPFDFFSVKTIKELTFKNVTEIASEIMTRQGQYHPLKPSRWPGLKFWGR